MGTGLRAGAAADPDALPAVVSPPVDSGFGVGLALRPTPTAAARSAEADDTGTPDRKLAIVSPYPHGLEAKTVDTHDSDDTPARAA